jgi:DNA-binding response OmpR family regulator
MTPEALKPKVLVVDDERVIADMLAAILRSEGFGVTAVYSGDDALQAARGSAPDALVCDIMLVAVNGIEIAMQIRAIHPDCTIILISGAQSSVELLEQARDQGHDFEVLAKPFHPTTLIERLRDLRSKR